MNAKKKVLFLSPYPEHKAPSQRLKYEQYYGHFKKAGYIIKTSSFVSLDFWAIIYKPKNFFHKAYYTISGYGRRLFDLTRIRKYDLVYVHLWVTPLGPPFFEWIVSLLAKKLIYDIDDLIYLKPKSKANPLVNLFKSANKSKVLMKNADHVIACTPHLDKFVKQFNPRTTDISSTIDTQKYIPKVSYDIKGQLTIGWSGSYSTSKYMYILSKVLSRLREEIDFRLLVIGDEKFNIDGIEVEAIPWKEESEVEDLSRIDIGLYPLPNEEWVLGKSGLKALQYMALGIPTIATAIGANFRIIENGVSGILVNNEEEWVHAIRLLACDVNLRKEIGQNARERVEALYSIEANKSTYLSIFDQVLSS